MHASKPPHTHTHTHTNTHTHTHARAHDAAFDIQNVSAEQQNGKGCFTCKFITNSLSMGCFINITEPNGRVFNITAMRNHMQAHTANVCTEGVLPQNSTLQVYGIDQDGKLSENPAYLGVFSDCELSIV